MAYATQSDIETIYGTDALYAAEVAGVVDAAKVTRALASASAEIDTYLAVRYALPVAPTEMLAQWAVDIALYRLASTADLMTEELRTRYEDALAALKRIADGKAALVQPAPEGEEGEDATPSSPRPILGEGPERLFTRDKMRGL